MAGPYASLTSPYAPGPGHMTDAFRIADLIGQQGQSAARAQLAKGLMVGNLVGDIGGAVGGLFARRDDAKRQAAENQQIADLIASGQPMDLAKLVAQFGVPRAKEIYAFTEAALAKQKTASQEANELGLRQRHADALKQGADPTAINLERWGEGASPLPASMLPDPAKVAAAAAAAAEKQARTELEAALNAAGGDPEQERRAYRAFNTAVGKDAPDRIFTPAPEKPATTPNPTEASLALLAAQGDAAAAKALALLRAQKATAGGSGAPAVPKLTGAQQDDLATMDTVVDLSGLATALGEKIGWKGVGGLWTGTIAGQAAKQLGWGPEDEEKLRNYLGNIQGTIAKLRGGTAFSVQEKAMLDSYTPGLNDSDTVIQSKLKSLGEFIALKRANALKYAGGATKTRGAGPFAVAIGDTTYRFQTKAMLDEYKRRAGVP